jgi:hypothetical protein
MIAQIGLSPRTLLSMALHPVRTMKWIVTFVPMMNQMKRQMRAMGSFSDLWEMDDDAE